VGSAIAVLTLLLPMSARARGVPSADGAIEYQIRRKRNRAQVQPGSDPD